jgi:hypothetical protein
MSLNSPNFIKSWTFAKMSNIRTCKVRFLIFELADSD